MNLKSTILLTNAVGWDESRENKERVGRGGLISCQWSFLTVKNILFPPYFLPCVTKTIQFSHT